MDATNIHLSKVGQCLIADANELVVITVILWIVKFVIFVLTVVFWLGVVLFGVFVVAFWKLAIASPINIISSHACRTYQVSLPRPTWVS